MAACTRCGFQQNGTQAYCERCGMFLPTLAIYNPAQPEYVVPSQVASPQIVPLPRSKQRFLEGDLTTAQVLNRCMREVIAIFGLLIASFGVFGTFNNVLGAGWALLLGLAVLIGGIIYVSILFFVQKLLPILRWSQILISGILATVVGFIMILVVTSVVQAHVLGRDLGLGTTLFLYGLVLAAIVVW